MIISNLTVEDHRETVMASYTLIDGETVANVTQQVSKHDLYWHDELSYMGFNNIEDIVKSYFNQNLK